MRTPEQFSDDVSRAVDRFDCEMSALGERIRLEVVAPACRKHALCFVSGMGMFFFRKRNRDKGDHIEPKYGDDADLDAELPLGHGGLSESAKATLRPVLHLLNKEISRGQYVGYMVDDYDPEIDK